jgi:hypothetical protein
MLSIADHIRECDSKYIAYKNHAINEGFSKEKLKYELDKELMDLYILLDWELERNPRWAELLSERLVRFDERSKESE